MEPCYEIIFEALEKGGGIEAVVSAIACGLQIPAAIVDPYGEIIADAYTSFLDYGKEEQKRERETWIRMMEEYYTQELAEGADAGQTVLCEGDGGVRVLSAVMVKSGLEGFCITLHEADEKDPCILNRLICRALSIGYGRKDHVYNLRDSGARQVMSRLLLGNGKDVEHMPRICDDVYEIYAAPPFMLAQIETERRENTNIWKLRCALGEHFQDALLYMEKNKLLVLFVGVESKKKKETVCAYLRRLLGDTECICAVSEPFDARTEIDAKKKMLERVAGIGRRINEEERFYTEYQYYMELVCSYAYEAMGEPGVFRRELELLVAEDREKGTEFYKSLREYLLMGNNVNLAAKKLFIHRNTMVYRLGKIHELLNIDVNDPEVAKRLLLSMLLCSCGPCGEQL